MVFSYFWKIGILTTLGLTIVGGAVHSKKAPLQKSTVNAWQCGPHDLQALCALSDEDQADRKAPIDWAKVTPRDKERQRKVLNMLSALPLKTSGDFFHAALIMQHGDTWEDYATAHQLSVRGLQLNPIDQNLQRMVAASWDRMMLAMGHKQWFGTNTFRNADGSAQPSEIRPDRLPQSLIDRWSQPWVWPAIHLT